MCCTNRTKLTPPKSTRGSQKFLNDFMVWPVKWEHDFWGGVLLLIKVRFRTQVRSLDLICFKVELNLKLRQKRYTTLENQHNNPSSQSAAYMRQWIGSALIQIMACSLFGTKPLSKQVLGYCQLDPKEQTSVKFESKYKTFHSRKCIWLKRSLRNGGHFVRGEMS